MTGSPSPKDFAALVVAERRMMHHAYNGLGRLQAVGATTGIEYNVYLESFLLHYRNVSDFLSPRPLARATDIVSTQFVAVPPSATAVVSYRDPIDKRLSHISKARVSVPLKGTSWNPAAMLGAIEQVWDAFLRELDRERPGWRPWFESLPGDGIAPIAIQVGDYSVVAASTSPTHVTVVTLRPQK